MAHSGAALGFGSNPVPSAIAAVLSDAGRGPPLRAAPNISASVPRRSYQDLGCCGRRIDRIFGELGQQVVRVLLLDQRLLDQSLGFREAELFGPGEAAAIRPASRASPPVTDALSC